MLANSQSMSSSDVEDMPREIEDTRHHNFVSSIERQKKDKRIEILFEGKSTRNKAEETHSNNQYEYMIKEKEKTVPKSRVEHSYYRVLTTVKTNSNKGSSFLPRGQ